MIAPLTFSRGDTSCPETCPVIKWQVRRPKASGPAFVDARIFLHDYEANRPYPSARGVTISHHEIDAVIAFLQAAKEATR